MRSVSVVLVLVLVLVLGLGCKKTADKAATPTSETPAKAQPAPPPEPAADYTETMTAFKDRICACADKPCVEKVQAEMKTWAGAHQDVISNLKPDEASAALSLGQDIAACVAKASGGGSN